MAAQDALQKLTKLGLPQKLAILGGVVAVVGLLFFTLVITPKQDEIGNLEDRLKDKQNKLAGTQTIASKLPQFKKEVERLDGEFERALKKLPEHADIANLLERIDNLGRGVNIDFKSFTPKKEQRKGFYATVPVQMNFAGTYHQIAVFLDRIAGLDRIVNVSNLKLSPIKGGRRINASCTLTTYRFLSK